MDINKKLKETKAALQALGQERINRNQQVDFLLDLVARFQDVMSNALRGNYGADDIFDKVKRFRLATTVIDRNDQFKSDMMNMGHIYRFRTEDDDESRPSASSKAKDAEGVIDDGHITTRKIDTRIDGNDALTDPELLSPPVDEDIFKWLRGMLLPEIKSKTWCSAPRSTRSDRKSVV